ncbi:MAG: septal ring lytic transglycosylase RlpA family protein [Minwuia sp.]|nr:septal ring lytic transglycosylase RlpA family protein [Minwuia sp.]
MTSHLDRSTWWLTRLAVPVLLLGLAGCAETTLAIHGAKQIAQADEARPGTRQIDAAKVRRASLRPYQIKGIWYYPTVMPDYDETGIASWYGDPFHGRKTASGEVYDKRIVTAAHKTLPLPSTVRVTNLENGRVLTVRVNDRGPFVNNRIIDMSQRGAQLLGFERQGVARVRVEVVGSDDDRFVLREVKTPTGEKRAGSAAPRKSVKVASLPPPQGSSGDAALNQSTPVTRPVVRSRPLTLAGGEEAANGQVRVVPTVPTRLFVQAGSFTQFQNADRLRSRLAAVGPAFIDHVLIDERDFFRVRLGPIDSVDRADQLLALSLNAGADDARIIVD